MSRFLPNLSIGSLRYDDWNVGIVSDPISRFLEPNYKPQVVWLPKQRGVIQADPFGVSFLGKVHIFFESSDYRNSKGVISCAEIQGTGPGHEPRTAIELPTHISYPYIFKHQGEIFCLPETGQAGEIALFRCERFPDRWKKVGTLIDHVAGIDGTLFKHEERWWLFFTIGGKTSLSDLHAWHAPDLLGPWQPHAKNPVKCDPGSARPGGTPFIVGGSLYRPAQDCSKTYGSRVIINKIIKLTPGQFVEERAAVVEPPEDGPYRRGVHTISAVENITLIDGKGYKFKVAAALRSLFRKRRSRPVS